MWDIYLLSGTNTAIARKNNKKCSCSWFTWGKIAFWTYNGYAKKNLMVDFYNNLRFYQIYFRDIWAVKIVWTM